MYDLGRKKNFAQVRLLQILSFENIPDSQLLVWFYGQACTNITLFQANDTPT
uniref:Uncharacterized protein n=1 Tax=Arundo donax TaxID=35708 RepID=A0A0A9EIB7_ARUDO